MRQSRFQSTRLYPRTGNGINFIRQLRNKYIRTSFRGVSMDWEGILRELRLLATQLQSDRFYALYLLVAVAVIGYLLR